MSSEFKKRIEILAQINSCLLRTKNIQKHLRIRKLLREADYLDLVQTIYKHIEDKLLHGEFNRRSK